MIESWIIIDLIVIISHDISLIFTANIHLKTLISRI